MKLAEALITRADAESRIYQLRDRLNRSVRVQEGDDPPEAPQTLLDELDQVLAQFTDLVQRINRTNAQTSFDDQRTITDALAERDALTQRRNILTGIVNTATQVNFRYSSAEIKSVVTVDVAALQREIDTLARQYREIDSAIQRLNWEIDLVEN